HLASWRHRRVRYCVPDGIVGAAYRAVPLFVLSCSCAFAIRWPVIPFLFDSGGAREIRTGKAIDRQKAEKRLKVFDPPR
ncbi:MAG TPA: hypothetical protein PKW42_12525, partial [bacterium]|nr:hypothetical protein [bacterium]